MFSTGGVNGYCFRLFPHFKSLPPEQINRQPHMRRLFSEPFSRAYYWIILLLLRKYFRLKLIIESSFVEQSSPEWHTTQTTKKPF